MADPFAIPEGAPTQGVEYQWRRLPDLNDLDEVQSWANLLRAGFKPLMMRGRPIDRHEMRLLHRPVHEALAQRVRDVQDAHAMKHQQLQRVGAQALERGLSMVVRSSFDGTTVVVDAGHGPDLMSALLKAGPLGVVHLDEQGFPVATPEPIGLPAPKED